MGSLQNRFVLLSVASSLSKEEMEKEGSLSPSGLERVILAMTPERVALEMAPSLVYFITDIKSGIFFP